MKKYLIHCLSAEIIDSYNVLLLVKDKGRMRLVLFDLNSEAETPITDFRGSRGFILGVKEDRYLVSIDDRLYLVEDSKAKPVLRASRQSNVFWHLAEADGTFFLQEYGEPPTYIYSSEDLIYWRRLISNKDVDRRSRHFHYIAYDPYRKTLIATLGDGCLTRVIVSRDLGETWNPLYRGPWQFLPVVPLRDYIVFGMDSGIAKGGIGIYNPKHHRWNFIFLKWLDRSIKASQMSRLLYSNNVWLAALGTPQAVIVSRDLEVWYKLYVEGAERAFNHYMDIHKEGRNLIIITGKSLILIKEEQIEEAFKKEPIMKRYISYIDRLKGMIFSLKRGLY